MFVREGVSFGGKELTIETGRMAKQADGSVVIRYGDTMVLVTAVASTSVRPGIDFMPLTVDYLEKTSAAGKIPGGYFKREGRMTEVEVLTLAPHRSPVAPALPQGLALRVAGHRDGGLHRSRELLRRAGDDGRVVRAASQRHPVGRSVRGRARRPHRRRARSSTRRSPQRADFRPGPHRRGEPRRDRHGRGWPGARGQRRARSSTR